jgi:hypothetical protein
VEHDYVLMAVLGSILCTGVFLIEESGVTYDYFLTFWHCFCTFLLICELRYFEAGGFKFTCCSYFGCLVEFTFSVGDAVLFVFFSWHCCCQISFAGI